MATSSATGGIVPNDGDGRKRKAESSNDQMADTTTTTINDANNDNSQPPNTNHHPVTSRQNQQSQNPAPKKRKRVICSRCHRPVPQTCLCESLPDTKIALQTTEVVVLQHPLELKNHKAASHRSLPLLELCLDSSSLVLKTGRRFGTEALGTVVSEKLWGTFSGRTNEYSSTCSYLPVLVFPKIQMPAVVANSIKDKSVTQHNATNEPLCEYNPNGWQYREDEATILNLRGLLERWNRETTNHLEENPASQPVRTKPIASAEAAEPSETNQSTNTNDSNGRKKILLLVLDATWKHAREMHIANIKAQQYPPHMLRLALERDDFGEGFEPGRFRLRGKICSNHHKKAKRTKQKKRNKNRQDNDDPSLVEDEAWMSTAESIARILSELEGGNRNSTTNDPQTRRVGTSNEEIQNEGSREASEAISLYEILMKPLDAMVAKWHSYRNRSSSNVPASVLSSKSKRDRLDFQTIESSDDKEKRQP